MASPSPSWHNQLWDPITNQKPKDGSGNGFRDSVWGQSILCNAVKDWTLCQIIQKHFCVPKGWDKIEADDDRIAEVFLDAEGLIIKPYQEGTAFRYSSVDAWFDPNCNPAIVSWIELQDVTLTGAVVVRRLRVLYGMEQYIQLSPGEPRLVSPVDLVEVQQHFVDRGLDHLQADDLDSVIQYWQNYINGSGQTPSGSPSVGPHSNNNARPHSVITNSASHLRQQSNANIGGTYTASQANWLSP